MYRESLLRAGLSVMYRWAFTEETDKIHFEAVENQIFALRLIIPLTLSAARKNLHASNFDLEAAFVVIYEGIGSFREIDYIFSRKDMEAIATVYEKMQLPIDKSIKLLKEFNFNG